MTGTGKMLTDHNRKLSIRAEDAEKAEVPFEQSVLIIINEFRRIVPVSEAERATYGRAVGTAERNQQRERGASTGERRLADASGTEWPETGRGLSEARRSTGEQ